MFIARLDLKAFGKFTDVSLDLSAEDRNFHLIYGPNEAGKSTSLRAITSLLFGMESNTDDCFLHRSTDIRVGGLLVDPDTGVQLDCVRRRGRKKTLRDADDNDPVDSQTLDQLLGGINRDGFRTRFGISYESLVSGGQAIAKGAGDLGEILFAAGAGVGQLRQLQEQFELDAAELFAPRATKARINAAVKGLDEDRHSMKELQVSNTRFESLRTNLAKHREAEAEAKLELTRVIAKLDSLDALKKAIAFVPSWSEAKDALEGLRDVPDLNEDFVTSRHRFQADLEIAKAEEQKLKERWKDLEKKLENLDPDHSLLEHDLEIQKLFQQIKLYEKSARELSEAKRAQGLLDEKVSFALEEILQEALLNVTQVKEISTESEQLDYLRKSNGLIDRMRLLAQQHKVLVDRGKEAGELFEVETRRIKAVEQQLTDFGELTNPKPLADLLENLGNPSVIADAVKRQRENCDKAKRQCEGLLHALKGFDGTVDEAIRIRLPSPAELEAIAQRIVDLKIAMTDQDGEVAQKQKQVKDVNNQLAEMAEDISCPTDDELQAARLERDQLIQDLARDASPETLKAVCLSVREVDELSDQRFKHAELIHAKVSLEGRKDTLEKHISQMKIELNGIQDTHHEAVQAWREIWGESGVRAGSVEEMRDWVKKHNALIESIEEMRDEETQLSVMVSDIQRNLNRLTTALGIDSSSSAKEVRQDQPELFQCQVEDELFALHDRALAERADRDSKWMEYQSLKQKHKEMKIQLPLVEARVDTITDELQQWSDSWREVDPVLFECGEFDSAMTMVCLDQLSQLNLNLKEREDLIRRVRHLQEDQNSFVASVGQLCEKLGEEPSDLSDVIALVSSLYRRMEKEKTSQRALESYREELSETEEKSSDAVAKVKAAIQSLSNLCREAGAETVEELPKIERESREKRELHAKFDHLNQQLLDLAAERDLGEFMKDAMSKTQSVWEMEITELQKQKDHLLARREELLLEIGAFENEFSKIDGDAKAFDLRQKMEHAVGQMRNDVEQYLVKRIGSKLLQQSIEHYRRVNQSPVLSISEIYFSRLTCGEYVKLQPDYDTSGKATLQTIDRSGIAKSVSEMSTGTADSLYLALRLASLQHQMESGVALPVVIDDCLIQLDDHRALAALESLSELSKRTQVILFTHHQHLIDLAREGLGDQAVRIHQLGA